MTSIGHHFYRKRWGFAILALLALAASVSIAQSPKKDKGPRALAVVELSADGKAGVRLTPIAILVSGRFWDASIYRADPRPFALDPGNVYEVERSGKPLGFFTIGEARQMQGRWIAFGNWESQSERPPAKPAKPAKVQQPVDDDRPVLHKRESAAPAQETQPAAKSSPPAPAPAPPAAEDPDRPLLRRGKPKPPPRELPEESPVKGNQPAGKTAPSATPAKEGELLAAISDAGGPDPRPFTYPVQPEEQKKLTKAVMDIATAEVARYVKNTPALRFAPASNFDQVAVRVFDLDYSNNPDVVLTARVSAVAATVTRARVAKPSPPAPDFFFYVTVVGQTDLYGQMRKLFSSVTDSGHLDAFPRLELIDAVDAEGTGRGDLLFRAWSGGSASYQLYHVGPDLLRKLFDSSGE